jgi:FAD/FMN-containing dehydrogenase
MQAAFQFSREVDTVMSTFGHTFSGPVFRPGDEGYDAERAGFNLAVDHHPELVVGAACDADVAAAVRVAAAGGLGLAVQATGHGPSAPADGALLVSTRRMDEVRVDPVSRTAVVGAGVRWQQVLDQAVPYGLAPLNGSNPQVGAVGYTLGGGIGLLGRRYGYAADHVRSLDVVTADGKLRRVSADRNPDLFWALRGGKGNFGVVVRMEIELMPVARLFGGGLYFPGEATADVLHAYREWTQTVPEEMASSIMLIRYLDDPVVPAPLRGRYVTHVRIAYSGPLDRGERIVRRLRRVGPRLLDTVTEMPYREVGSIHHEPTEPVAAYDTNVMLAELAAETVDTIVSLAGPEADAPFILELRHHGGAYARPAAVPNAVGGRDAAFTLLFASLFESNRREEIRSIHDLVHDKLRPWTTGGSYLNFLGVGDVATDRVRTAFTPADYARLTSLKSTYDPTNVFCVNHNIPPKCPRPLG